MHFANCAALAVVYLVYYFNRKFETLFFWGWDCS